MKNEIHPAAFPTEDIKNGSHPAVTPPPSIPPNLGHFHTSTDEIAR